MTTFTLTATAKDAGAHVVSRQATFEVVSQNPQGPRFFGDPGLNKMYLGGTGPAINLFSSNPEAGMDYFEDTPHNGTVVGSLSLQRSYATNNVPNTAVNGDIAERRVSAASFKLGGTTASFTSAVTGAKDSDLQLIVDKCKANPNHIFFLTAWHEPEDNFTTPTLASQFRNTFRYCVSYFRSAGVTNAVWVSPYYMTPWSFQVAGTHNPDWRWWHPDWMGTALTPLRASNGTLNPANPDEFHSDRVVDIIGFDVYNPQDLNTTDPATINNMWRSFEWLVSDVLRVMDPLDKPYGVGELGSRPAFMQSGGQWVIDGTKTKQWWIDAFNYALTHNFIFLGAYNERGHAFENDGDPGYRYQAFAELNSRPEVARPTA